MPWINHTVLAKWIMALTGGYYRQCSGALVSPNDNTSFCCLGVLEDLWAKEHVPYYEELIEHDRSAPVMLMHNRPMWELPVPLQKSPPESVTLSESEEYERSWTTIKTTQVLDVVRRWAGVQNETVPGKSRVFNDLAMLNDSGRTFWSIAAILWQLRDKEPGDECFGADSMAHMTIPTVEQASEARAWAYGVLNGTVDGGPAPAVDQEAGDVAPDSGA